MKSLQSQKTVASGYNQGFTLIELSIVLVIIGLIVGGVLVGQDLIRAAEIRATISQIEKYNTAVNTFRNKYNGIPGDLAQAQASAFGLFTLTDATIAGQGDGNGLVEGGASGAVVFLGEIPVFWRHLSDGGYVDGSFGAGTTITASTGAVTGSTPSTYIPAAKLGRGNYVTIASAGGYNYFIISGISAVNTGAAYTATDNLSPQESYNIDKKTDDGLPGSGSINALNASTSIANSTATISTLAANTLNCVTGTSPATYNLSGTYGSAYGGTSSATGCSLRLRFN